MSRWTAADLPDMSERTVVVTGASRGLGLITARELARVGARVVLAVRDTAKGAAAAASIRGRVEVRELDVSDLRSVRRFAQGWSGNLDVLINNAGIMNVPLTRTADGLEPRPHPPTRAGSVHHRSAGTRGRTNPSRTGHSRASRVRGERVSGGQAQAQSVPAQLIERRLTDPSAPRDLHTALDRTRTATSPSCSTRCGSLFRQGPEAAGVLVGVGQQPA